ncbi:MAG: diguanylate cyclase [Burkholderiaceae bacterium]|nr:diguanylate cyclase [Rhodoferax sp.]MCP5284491.1 diguanylate cyclase [Burkholderiaceae bacterium]
MTTTPANSVEMTVLVVDDSTVMRRVLCDMLVAHGHRALEAADGHVALAQFSAHRPDLVLLDVELPGQDGYAVARAIRAAEAGSWTPIIFLSGHGDDRSLWDGIAAGGDDYLTKPVGSLALMAKLHAMQRLQRMRRRLVELTTELQEANERLENLSRIDALTGLGNRRDFDLRLAAELDRCRRDGKPMTLMLCDVDHFKRYNDWLGHPAGDACLQALAEVLRGVVSHRPRHAACRYGGEEFALLLPEAPPSGALAMARVLQRVLASRALPHPKSKVSPYVTLSGGITTCTPDERTNAADLVLRADAALYTAKQAGRARFWSFDMQVEAMVPSARLPEHDTGATAADH